MKSSEITSIWGSFLKKFTLFYNTVLVLPYINMNLPRVYTCSQSYPPSNPNSSPVHSMTLVINVCVYAQSFSHVRLFVTFQIPLSMGSSRQEYCSELPCPLPGDLPAPGVKPASLLSCIGRQVLYHHI